jgi:antirestriction protein ArdC
MPSGKWTLRNRFLAFLQTGEIDCRGFRQWKNADRTVKKGSSAAYILAPILVPEKNDQGHVITNPDTGKPEMKCVGFKGVAVFSVEDTEGKPLDYENPEIIAKLPLIEIAHAEGIPVKGRPFDGHTFGYYHPDNEMIALCTEDEKTYLHELCHHFDNKAAKEKGSKLKGGQHVEQEIVAELGAAVLARLYGKRIDVRKDSYEYIKTYANRENKEVLDACLSVLSRTANVISRIMEAADKLNLKANETQLEAA